MATTNTFVIEYGLSVGSTEVINSSGKIVASALSTIDTDAVSYTHLTLPTSDLV